MVDATRFISEGQHDLRLDISQQDEFGHLARFLNKLLDQLFEERTADLEIARDEALKSN